MLKKLKIIFPIIIIGQLTAIIISVNWDRAFQCKMVNPYLICKQLKIK